MLTASRPEDDVNHLTSVYIDRYAERKPGSNKGQGCYPCMILHLPLFSMYNLRYKSSFWKKSCRPCSPKLGNPMSFFFLSLSLSFSGWLPGAQRLYEFTFLPGLLTLTQEGSQGGVPSAVREGTCGLCEQCESHTGALLAFCENQGISASFSPLLS